MGSPTQESNLKPWLDLRTAGRDLQACCRKRKAGNARLDELKPWLAGVLVGWPFFGMQYFDEPCV